MQGEEGNTHLRASDIRLPCRHDLPIPVLGAPPTPSSHLCVSEVRLPRCHDLLVRLLAAVRMLRMQHLVVAVNARLDLAIHDQARHLTLQVTARAEEQPDRWG